MIAHGRRERPLPWHIRKQSYHHAWIVPFVAFEWVWEWVAYFLGNWTFLEVLEYLGSFSVLVAVIFYFTESGNRLKLRHYQAWQVINTAQGKGGSGGRIEALQELNADNVPLVGVDVSSAFLQGIRLVNANLLRADFSSADLRNGSLIRSSLTLANLNSANFRNAHLDDSVLEQADLTSADLNGCSLAGADLSGATLDDADLQSADLRAIRWQNIKSMVGANIAHAKNPPDGFVPWALAHGAIEQGQ